jgi:hypothetical protein
MRDTLQSFLFLGFAWLLFCTTTAFSQAMPTATLKGTVVDDSTSAVLENVDVFLSQTTFGSATDKHGRFEIKNVPFGSYEIIVSRVGYQMRSTRVVVSQSSPEELKVSLRPKLIAMNEVAVTAADPGEWKAQLEKFKKLFFGESELASEAQLLNPEILDFTGNANPDFEATARMPLEIDNLALGYHLQFILTRFVVSKTSPGSGGLSNSQQYLNCVGKERFIELTPTSVEEGARWNANRMQAYKGSFRHFLVSLFRSELSREGFIMGLIPPQSSNRRSTGFVESINEKDVLSDGEAPYEKILHFTGTLVVKYVGEPVSAQKHLLDAAIPAVDVSSVRLNYESVRITSQGAIRDWAPTRLYGYWAASRIADALPLDYQPKVPTSSNNDTNSAAAATAPTYIVPLAIGNQWTMRTSLRDGQGKLISSSIQTSQILSDSTIDGERWFVMHTPASGDNPSRTSLGTNRPDGFYVLKSGVPLLNVKYPAHVGDNYHGFGGDAKVLSTNEKISVPKGTFICYQYSVILRGPAMGRATICYCPGVGLVSVEGVTLGANNVSTANTSTVELVDYTIH